MRLFLSLTISLLCCTINYSQNPYVNTQFGTNGSTCISTPDAMVMGDLVKVNNEYYGISSFSNYNLIKLAANGTISTTFGNNGFIPLNLAYSAGSVGDNSNGFLKLLPNNHLLAVANYSDYTTANFICMTNLNGSLVTSFGNNGYVAGVWPDLLDFKSVDVVNNEIIITATNFTAPMGNSYRYLLVMKYDMNGNPITSYGINGTVKYYLNSNSAPIQIQYLPDTNNLLGLIYEHTDTDFTNYVIKLDLTENALDQNFGNNGYYYFTNENDIYNYVDVLHATNDGIYIAGMRAFDQTGDISLFMTKLSLNGEIDNTFGINGFFLKSIDNAYCRLSTIVVKDGKITLSGYVDVPNDNDNRLLLLRTSYSGISDVTFGNGGVIKNGYSYSTFSHVYKTIVENSNIVTAAIASKNCSDNSQTRPAVVQFNTATLSTKENDIKTIQYYPNPITDYINITGINQIKQVDVYDVSGKAVATFMNPEDGRINLSELQSGFYIMKVNSENSSANLKIVKK